MEQELAAKLHAYYGASPSRVEQKHLDFALSNRTRGKKVIDQVVKRTGLDLRGKRVLDVGSAYGGFVIEAARRGAEAWGVEISARLHELGKINARGEAGDIHQVHADFLSRKVLAELPRDFDLVLVNDVFEHVYDTAALLKQLHALMRDGAPFMFAIPNGDAVSSVEREGHNLTPGISQLAPNWWHHAVKEFTAFYRPWSYYSGLYRAFGFERIETWTGSRRGLADAKAEIAAGLEKALAATRTLDLDRQTRATLDAALEDYQARLAADLTTGDAALLNWRYLTTFWKGCAYKGGEIIADVGERPTTRVDPITGFSRRVRALASRARELVPRARPTQARRNGASGTLTPISLDRSDAELASRWCLRSKVTFVRSDGALRCDIAAEETDGGHYGGMRLPLATLTRLRLDLELIGAEHIEAVYVDGEDGRRGRVVRWQWAHPSANRAREVFELAPGSDGDSFCAVPQASAAEVAELHVFVRVAPGQRAGFVLHRVEAA